MRKRSLIKLNRADRIFIVVAAGLILVKTTVDAFSLYSNGVRDGTADIWWVPFVEQYTSYVLLVICLPFIVWAVGRFTLTSIHWPKYAAYHLGFSIMFFVVHVLGFIVLRKVVFYLLGGHYTYGGWPQTALLEYPLDLSSYLIISVSYIVMTKLSAPQSDIEQTVELNCGSRSIWVKPSEIIYAKAAGNYVDLVLTSRTHLVRSTLEGLQVLINENAGNLRRVHRSILVNPEHIRERTPAKNGSRMLCMSNGNNIAMSRRYVDALD